MGEAQFSALLTECFVRCILDVVATRVREIDERFDVEVLKWSTVLLTKIALVN